MKFLNWSNVPMTTKKFKVKIIRIYEFYMLAGRMNIISISQKYTTIEIDIFMIKQLKDVILQKILMHIPETKLLGRKEYSNFNWMRRNDKNDLHKFQKRRNLYCYIIFRSYSFLQKMWICMISSFLNPWKGIKRYKLEYPINQTNIYHRKRKLEM